MSCLLDLPDGVLRLVMQHVPFRDRLGSCCLVSRRMYAAAVAGTEELQLDQQSAHVVDWLTKHGLHLTRLQLNQFRKPLQLPCQNLLELSCEEGSGCYVWLGLMLQSCTKLTRLQLMCCIKDVDDGAATDSLSNLVHLRHLQIQPPVGGSRVCVSAATLPRLQQLTHLGLNHFSVENLLQLGGLTSLQELSMGVADVSIVGPGNVPGLAFPASLTNLQLSSDVEANMLSLLPATLQELELGCVFEGPAEGPGLFLDCIARLQHLTGLSWGSSRINWPPPGPAYSAFTASSKLVTLHLCDKTCPSGIWQFVFRATHPLPHLTHLGAGYAPPVVAQGSGNTHPLCHWDAADLDNLVSCCPGLADIDWLHLRAGPHLSELQRLTALTWLAVSVVGISPDGDSSLDESVMALAVVTQLSMLTVGVETAFSVADLLPLTSLTALDWLEVFRFGADSWADNHSETFSTSPPPEEMLHDDECYHPVWLQLLARCSTEPDCQFTAMLSLGQLEDQRAQLDQQVACLQEKLTEQQQHSEGMQSGLQRQVQELQAEVLQLRELLQRGTLQ